MKNKFILSLLLFIYLIPVHAYDYPVSDIPDSLVTDAVSVVRKYTTEFTQFNKNTGAYKVDKAITILNKQGDRHAEFVFSGDIKFEELTKFSAVIRNASGNIIRKIKKGDLTYTTLDNQSLASNGYQLFYTFQSPSYPYTIEYSYEVKYSNGIIAYPPFFPTRVYQQSVMNADHTLAVPSDMKVRSKSEHNISVKTSKNEKSTIYSASIQGIKPLLIETFSPLQRDLLPHILFAPDDFCYDSACGNMSTWKDYGLWVHKLLEGRDILPNDLTSKLNDLIKDAKDDREKVKIIYEYLQNNSRYISIQLGIGGFQPIEAEKVAKTKFGDCKGLSNLMKALLKAAGVSSHYCEIYSGHDQREFHSDFANINQTNHAILLVPLKNDSIWLECTSQTIPFGFVHSNIAGHDALVVTEEGGKVCRLPSYSPDKKRSEVNIVLNIKEDGNIDGNLEITERLDVARRAFYKLDTDRKSQTEHVGSELTLPKVNFGDITYIMDKSFEPKISIKTNFEGSDFVNKTGNRLFVPICPLYKGNFKIFSSNKRNYDIHIDDAEGYLFLDTITYNLPEGYKVEALPKDIDFKNQFGSINIQLTQNENSIICSQRLELKPGKYDKSAYSELKSLFAQTDSSLKRKLVLRKE